VLEILKIDNLWREKFELASPLQIVGDSSPVISADGFRARQLQNE